LIVDPLELFDCRNLNNSW